MSKYSKSTIHVGDKVQAEEDSGTDVWGEVIALHASSLEADYGDECYAIHYDDVADVQCSHDQEGSDTASNTMSTTTPAPELRLGSVVTHSSASTFTRRGKRYDNSRLFTVIAFRDGGRKCNIAPVGGPQQNEPQAPYIRNVPTNALTVMRFRSFTAKPNN